MQIKDILSRDDGFKYMLLDRLRSDCVSYLSHGGKLWGLNPKDHMETMIAIWKDLKIKPEWLTLPELKDLSYRVAKIKVQS